MFNFQRYVVFFLVIASAGYARPAPQVYEGNDAALIGIVLDSTVVGGYPRYCVVTANATNPPYIEYSCISRIAGYNKDPFTQQYSFVNVDLGPSQMIGQEGILLLNEIQQIDKNLTALNQKYWDTIKKQPYLNDPVIKSKYDSDPAYKAQYDASIESVTAPLLNDMEAQLAQRAKLDYQLQRVSKPVVETPSTGILGQEWGY